MHPDLLIAYEWPLRLGGFVLLSLALVALERAHAFREASARPQRWLKHLGLAAIGALLVRIALPIAAVGTALHAQAQGLGLSHLLFPAPRPLLLELALGLACWLILDAAIYLQHRVFHAWPPLWRLHRVHHSDVEFDTSTAIRFHPLEIALSMAIKMALVLALGAPAWAVLLFELSLSLSALWTHANLHLPDPLDRRLRWLLVTPDMHRIHHSVRPHETDSNFGFCLSLWDRLFASYRAASEAPQQQMAIGLDEFRSPRSQKLLALLALPFRRRDTEAS